ncbi:hypothetical protein GGR51DRAFT_331203 [Nemania sp. FL0031]|nr:hypothetical protein GGR51DRAFT_331203 [Nemania sp. FL0031]
MDIFEFSPPDYWIPEYQYSRLDSSSDSIRLLRLDHKLEYKLETYSIQSCPSFFALSYTWGGPQNTQNIQIDGKTLRIQHNLSLCLAAIKAEIASPSIAELSQKTRLRSQKRMLHFLYNHHAISGSEGVHFWIDAICINQNDTTERNHQVNMMERIYSTAAFVLVWLGEADKYSDLAFDEISRSEYHNLAPSLALDAIEPLFQRDYWGRLWVIQELMLAQDILLMCGNQTLRWCVLVRWLEQCPRSGAAGNLGFHLGGTRGGRLIEQKIVWQRRVLSLNRGYSLDLLIELFHGHECADVRDKVYGLLGLLTSQNLPESQDIIYADYGKTRLEVYKQVLEAVCRSPRLRTDRSRSRFCKTLQRALRLSLSYEAACGNEAMVKLLLEDGAYPGWGDEHEQTPLLAAVESGHEKVVRLLLERGANLESKAGYRQTPLLLAVKKEHGVVIRLLLAQGVNLGMEDTYKQTPLFFARSWGHGISFETINLDLKDEHERTLVSLASRRRHKAVVRLLMEKGADLDVTSKSSFEI